MPAQLRPAVSRLAAIVGECRTDAALVADFLRHADQGAFAELVRRHGPMVLGVCRRFLGHTPDAADAFQATFLVLVRRARRDDWRESLGPWLYGVALRTARKARAARSRRRATEAQVSPMTPEPATRPAEPDDLAAVLDEELAAVPEIYRTPLVLCELQGASRADAARELGLPEGTLSSRLARGRRILRDRLARRGVAPAVALATVPAELTAATARHAAAVLSLATGTVPAAVLSLTEGVVKAMVVKWKLAAVVVAACLGMSGFEAWEGLPVPTATAAAGPQEPPKTPPGKPSPADPGPGPDDAPAVQNLRFHSDEPPAPKAIATIFGDQEITRDSFADHLIRRYGKKELELFVNKQIVARAFGKKGWTISADDVQRTLDEDCKAMGVTREQFAKDVLPRYNKTLDEWTEDVITPRLMLTQLGKTRLAPPTEAELRQAFAAKYGEKVQCQVITWTKDQGDEARKVYEKVKGDVEAFKQHVMRHSDPTLARSAGLIAPTPLSPMPGGEEWEGHAAVAKLKKGEVTPLVATKDGYMVARCVAEIPADATKKFEDEKPSLFRELTEAKLNRDIPKLFNDLKREASPKYHLTLPEPVVRPNPVPGK